MSAVECLYYFRHVGAALVFSVASMANTGGSLSAQPHARENVLQLDMAIALAMDRNPQLQQQRAMVDQLRSATVTEYFVEDPAFQFAIEGVDGFSKGFMERRYGISQTFVNPSNWNTHLKLRQLNLDIERQRLKALERELITRVKKQFLNVVIHTEYVHLGKLELELAKRLHTLTTTRYEVGEIGRMDVLRTSILLAEAQNALKQSEELELLERYELLRLIAEEPDGTHYEMSFPDTLHAPVFEIDQIHLRQKIADHPNVSATKIQHERSRLLSGLTRRSIFPDIEVGAYRQDLGSSNRFNVFELGVTLPIWKASGQGRRVQGSKAAERQTMFLIDDVRSAMLTKAEVAWHGYTRNRDILLNYRGSIGKDSRDLQALSTVAWTEGETGILDVLEAQRTLIRTDRMYYEILLRYMQSIADLESILDEEFITNSHFIR